MQYEYTDSTGWHHYKQVGTDEIIIISHVDGYSVKARIWEEEVTTGKQRAHAGYRTQVDARVNSVRIKTYRGYWCSGTHPSKQIALRDVAEKMKKDGCLLDAWGLDPGFYETGLSACSGYGYIREKSTLKPVRNISGKALVSVGLKDG